MSSFESAVHNAATDEYARLDQLLTLMARTTQESMHEIQQVNTQMRMISCNSRIEAARAGERGKAFAVVTDEIKSLSDRTAVVADTLRKESSRSTAELKSICHQISTQVRGTRLCDLALTNIDLIDRNLYERSCDVRWWATDASLVSALSSRTPAACAHASERMGVILNAYTVYFDLVLCDLDGTIIANGRPRQYASKGLDQSQEPWFRQALRTSSGEQFGFQSVHESRLVKGKRALVYSAAVREDGHSRGHMLGALGIVFNYDALAQTIMHNTPISEHHRKSTRVCITDKEGLLLADSGERILQEKLALPDQAVLQTEAKGYAITEIEGRPYCIAHARAPGFETYCTGWHSWIIQPL